MHQTSSSRKFIVFICFAWLLIILFGELIGPKEETGYFNNYVIYQNEHVDYGSVNPRPCEIESWNQKNTSSFPFYDLYKEYANMSEGPIDGELRLMSAFLYDDHIVVTHTVLASIGRRAYCHYHDCNRRKIDVFESFVYPMTAVHCPRRAGAWFMSISFGEMDVPPEPIPLINRILKKPPHEVGVCVGKIDRRKPLEIIEYIEHHKLLIDGSSGRAVDDYRRTGDIEVTKVHLEYENVNHLFDELHVNECFFRSKYHSKWLIHVDIDERLVMSSKPLLTYLRQLPPEICQIKFTHPNVLNTALKPHKTHQMSPKILQHEGCLGKSTTSSMSFDDVFAKHLKRRVTRKWKFLYDTHPIWCSSVDAVFRRDFAKNTHCSWFF